MAAVGSGVGKPRHRWTKEIANVDFFANYEGATAQVRWVKRDQMLVKKGAKLRSDIPLLKDGSLGFAAKFALQLRQMNADKIKNNVTTEDITLKSPNEVGHLLYFAGTNSWLVLKDEHGKTLDEYSAVP